MDYKIDATNKKIGRIASQAASVLMGKNSVFFARNIAPKVKVMILNVSNCHIDKKKLDVKRYSNYSGYPAGLKKSSIRSIASKKGYEAVIWNAVYGMLPKNKLRDIMIKNLIITK